MLVKDRKAFLVPGGGNMNLMDSIWQRSPSVTLAWAEGWAEAGPQSIGHDVIGSCGPLPPRALGEAGSCPLILSTLQKGAESSSSLFVVCDFLQS